MGAGGWGGAEAGQQLCHTESEGCLEVGGVGKAPNASE